MKKVYSKPALFAETFALTTHISKCDGVRSGAANFSNAATCSFHLGNVIDGPYVFTSNTTKGTCALISDTDEYGDDCYNGVFGLDSVSPFDS